MALPAILVIRVIEATDGIESGLGMRKQPRWDLTIARQRHVVELGPPTALGGAPRRFAVDGQELTLGGWFHLGPRVADFDVAGRPARLTMRMVGPNRRIRLRRVLGRLLNPRSLGAIVASALAGGGSGAGVAADRASAAMLAWTIYELTVDGRARGAWVATNIGGEIESWHRVRSGEHLPDGSNETWPIRADVEP